MYNRRYDKAFIMLKQELGGFSLGQQSAWGSCVMELKNKTGRFTFSVQGLKKLTDGRRYEAFLIGGKGTAMKGISCGVIHVDQHGKGELKWEFDPEKIGRSCFCVEELHTAALLVKGGYGLIVPLVGYFNEKVAWKKLFQEEQDLRAAEAILSEEEEEQKKIKEQKPQSYEAEPEQPKKPENIVEEQKKPNVVNLKVESSPFQKNFKNMLFQFKKELEKLEENGILTQLERQQIQGKEQISIEQPKTEKTEQPQEMITKIEIPQQKTAIEEVKAEPTKIEQTAVESTKMEQTEIEQISEQKKDIAYLLQHNDEIQPFERGVWKSIALEELVVLPVDSIKMMKNLFYIFAYRKYKHFILQKTGEKEYILGVPAQYQPEMREEAEKLLFDSFQPCGKETMKTGCYGYWLRKIKESY